MFHLRLKMRCISGATLLKELLSNNCMNQPRDCAMSHECTVTGNVQHCDTDVPALFFRAQRKCVSGSGAHRNGNAASSRQQEYTALLAPTGHYIKIKFWRCMCKSHNLTIKHAVGRDSGLILNYCGMCYLTCFLQIQGLYTLYCDNMEIVGYHLMRKSDRWRKHMKKEPCLVLFGQTWPFCH